MPVTASINSAGDAREGHIAGMLIAMILLAVLSQFLRSSTGVIAPDIMAELDLGADDMGYLSSAFFVVFALLQIPVGVFLDRFGPRRVLAGMMVSTVIGSLVFALGQSFAVLVAGRLMMGFGCAGLMVGSLVVLSRWCRPERFTRTLALLFAAANAGSLIATLPLAAAAAAFGWRWTFVGLAAITALLTAIFAAAVRDAPPGETERPGAPRTLWASLAGIVEVARIPGLPSILPIVAVGYASVITVLGLWGGPYLHDVYGLDGVARGNVLSAMAVAMIAGTLFYGPLDRRFNTRKGVVLAGAVTTAAVFLVMAVMPNPSLAVASALLALLSFVGAYSLVAMAHGMALFTKELAGRGSTTLNLALMGGAAAMQAITAWIAGLLADSAGSAPAAPYQAVFLFLGVSTLAAVALYYRTLDVRPSI
jgi:predicted MFS family arabinose efflux permease